MSTMLFAAPAALPLASFRRAVSAPVPWYASHAARRAAANLNRAVRARSPRIAVAVVYRRLCEGKQADRMTERLVVLIPKPCQIWSLGGGCWA